MGVSAETALIFQSGGEVVHDPLKIESDSIVPDSIDVEVTNMSLESLTDLGIYLRPSTNLGPLDNPAESPPTTDYQDILMWGTRSEGSTTFEGGIRITVPGKYPIWVTNKIGGFYTNRIPVDDLSPSGSFTFKVEFIVPQEGTETVLDARRLFIAVVVG